MKKVYPKYRETNIPWLPIMPDHWDEKPLKHSLTINACTLSESTLPTFTFLYIDIESVVEGKVSPELQKMSFSNAPSRARRIVKKGDVVLSTVRTYLKATAQIPYSDTPIIVSTGFATFHESTKIDKDFLKFLVRQDSFINEIVALSTGVSYPAISPSRLGNIKIPLPPLPEQHQIAAFLDHKCALIDTFIQKKTRLIELLKEQKQAIINKAVTRGIDPNVRLKPSGIEWLGDIPEGWEVRKLKYFIKDLESGSSVNAFDEPAQKDEVGVLKTSCVYTYEFRCQENKKVFSNEIERVNCPVRANTIIISRMNTPELVGASGYVAEDHPNLFLPDRLWQTVFFPNVKVNIQWLHKLLTSFEARSYIGSIATGSSSSMKNISKGDLMNFQIGVPPRTEQSDILNYIRIESKKIDETTAKIEREIELVQEYKTTLIAEAVTGKIDVRNWKPKEHSLPIETKKAATL